MLCATQFESKVYIHETAYALGGCTRPGHMSPHGGVTSARHAWRADSTAEGHLDGKRYTEREAPWGSMLRRACPIPEA